MPEGLGDTGQPSTMLPGPVGHPLCLASCKRRTSLYLPSGGHPSKCCAVCTRPHSGPSQPGRTQLLLLDLLTQATPLGQAAVPTSHSLAVDVASTQNQPLLFCASPSERVNKKRLFRRPTDSRAQNWTQITSKTHTEPLWVLSLSLLCFTRHNTAGKTRNLVY